MEHPCVCGHELYDHGFAPYAGHTACRVEGCDCDHYIEMVEMKENQMPCPECHSHNLWDDLAWWGCKDCGWRNGRSIYNRPSPEDRFEEEKESNAE